MQNHVPYLNLAVNNLWAWRCNYNVKLDIENIKIALCHMYQITHGHKVFEANVRKWALFWGAACAINT